MNAKKPGKITSQELAAFVEELDEMTVDVERLIEKYSGLEDLDEPVIFAAAAMYALERSGRGNEEAYEKVIYPLLEKKVQHLHNEGAVAVVWAFSQMENVNESVLGRVLERLQGRDCLLYTSPSPRDKRQSRMPSSA